MKKRIILALSIGMLLILALTQVGQAGTSEHYAIKWMVPLTGAGGREASSANYTLNCTIGQTTINSSESLNYGVQMGFWQEFLTIVKLYLPLILK